MQQGVCFVENGRDVHKWQCCVGKNLLCWSYIESSNTRRYIVPLSLNSSSNPIARGLSTNCLATYLKIVTKGNIDFIFNDSISLTSTPKFHACVGLTQQLVTCLPT